MPGPMPKDPALRQRRNKVSTRATLAVEDSPRRRAPALPKRADGKEWDHRTRAYWRAIWHSPMAAEYLEADVHGLFMLAEMVEAFYQAPSAALLDSISRQRQCFGLTPLDRRRLQWEVERVEAVTQKKKGSAPPSPAEVEDRRAALRVLA